MKFETKHKIDEKKWPWKVFQGHNFYLKDAITLLTYPLPWLLLLQQYC